MNNIRKEKYIIIVLIVPITIVIAFVISIFIDDKSPTMGYIILLLYNIIYLRPR